jgi:hypothetical protein
MSTTDKNRNLMRRLGRPELVRAFDDPTLPEVLARDPTPPDRAIVAEMRTAATAVLEKLRDRLLAD